MNNNLAIFEKSLAIGSLSAYIHWTQQLPMLSAEEEQDLALRLTDENDIEAARKLVLSHLRLVVKIARGYKGYGLQQEDLIQEGNIGLMKAVKRFDPKVGVRLMSYALHWIKAEIHEFVIKNWRIVKVATTKAQRKLFFNLRKLSQSQKFSESEVNMVAEELKVKPEEVRTMAQRLSQYDESFHGIESSDNDNNWAPEHYLEDSSNNPALKLEQLGWENEQITKLHQGIKSLDPRARDIIASRFLNAEKATLSELATKYEVSAERIRQLEKNAFKQIKNIIEATH